MMTMTSQNLNLEDEKGPEDITERKLIDRHKLQAMQINHHQSKDKRNEVPLP